MNEEKKYQFFISSTYVDLIEERREVLDAVLETDNIPAGMEFFVAEDEEQFEVIKRVIDLCDYYILIIGGRYGTINKITGKSYTEMEYDYAREKNIPIVVFFYSNIDSLPNEKKETSEENRKKLIQFREKATMSTMASEWKEKGKLKVDVIKAIYRAIKKYDRPGWTRGDQRKEEKKDLALEAKEILKSIEKTRKITFYYDTSIDDAPFSKVVECSYKKIFSMIAGAVISKIRVEQFNEKIDDFCVGWYTTGVTHDEIKSFFVGKGIMRAVSIKENGEYHEFIELTELGHELLKIIYD